MRVLSSLNVSPRGASHAASRCLTCSACSREEQSATRSSAYLTRTGVPGTDQPRDCSGPRPRVVIGWPWLGVKDRSVTAPSYEQLAALVAAQERMIAQLQARIAEQDAEIAELKRQLAASSRNSSKPPSSDGLDKPAPKSLRGRSGRQPGGQPGRQGRTLRQVSVPDEVVVHDPGTCAGCRAKLGAEGPPARVIRRQVFDIPQITVRVVEHRLISRRCACGALTAAAGPAGVTAPVSYGPRAA